jgi:HEAT repeat protein
MNAVSGCCLAYLVFVSGADHSQPDRQLADLVRSLANGDKGDRIAAAKALRVLGSEAKDALPGLQNALRDKEPDVRYEVGQTMIEIGPLALPYLLQAMNFKERGARRAAAQVLADLTTPSSAKSVIRVLITALRDEDDEVRSNAVAALGRIGDHEAVEPLIELARTDREREVRAEAVRALGNLGPMAAAAVPVIVDTMKVEANRDGISYVAETVEALASIGPAAVPSIVRVVKSSDDGSPPRRCALMSLARMAQLSSGKDLIDVVPVLVDVIGETDRELACMAAQILGKLGPRASIAVRVLTKMAREGSSTDRVVAAESLYRINPEDSIAITTLLEGLIDKNSTVRQSSAYVLRNLHPKTSLVLKGLTAALWDSEPTVRLHAAYALGAMEAFAVSAVPDLAHLLGDDEEFVRVAACHAFANMGESAKAAVPALCESLTQPSAARVRAAAADALGAMGSWAEPAVPALRKALRDPNESMRQAALRALQKIPGAPTTIEIIR